jgi:hypothetical protein
LIEPDSITLKIDTENVEIRDVSLEEAGLAATFFHEQWRPNHIFYRNRDLLLWQYHDNPYASQFSPGMTFRAAFRRGVNTAICGYIPFRFNMYGEKQFGCHLSALWVAPEYRRGPLALRLLHSLQHNSPFNACIAGMNTPIAERLYERMSWVVVSNIPRLIRVIDSVQFKSLLDPALPVTLPAQALRSPVAVVGAKERDGIELMHMESLDALSNVSWDDFYWGVIAPKQMGPARETVYLRWRYGKIPVFQYHALLAKRLGEVRGLLIYRVECIKDSEQQVIRLVDLVAVPEFIPSLVDALAQLAVEQGASFIDFFCTSSSYLDQLAASGFVDARDSTGTRYWCPYLFQPLDHARNRLNSAWWIRNLDLKGSAARSDFCIMKGDHEFDRPN